MPGVRAEEDGEIKNKYSKINGKVSGSSSMNNN
jgi:hypothetical protein